MFGANKAPFGGTTGFGTGKTQHELRTPLHNVHNFTCLYTKSSVESHKGVIEIQTCSLENYKGAIAVQSLWRCALLVVSGTSFNCSNALQALNIG